MNNRTPLLNTTQAAEYLSIHPETLRTKAITGKIRAYKLSQKKKSEWRFKVSDLDSYIDSCLMEVTPKRKLVM